MSKENIFKDTIDEKIIDSNDMSDVSISFNKNAFSSEEDFETFVEAFGLDVKTCSEDGVKITLYIDCATAIAEKN